MKLIKKEKLKFKSSIKLILIVFVLFQTVNISYAQNSKEEKYYANNEKHWLIDIPIWIPSFRGQLSSGEINSSPSPGDEDRVDSRLESETGLEFYFVGRVAARYNNVWVQTDAFSGEIGATFSHTSPIGNNEKEIVEINIQGTIPRLVLGYSVWQKANKNSFKLEILPYLGVRYVSIHLETEVFDSTNIINKKPNWFEPVIGLYLPIDYKRFKIEIQGDYGNNGTNYSWNISNRYRYRISKLLDVQLGWNLIELNHKGEELKTTIALFGPMAGVGFSF